jgi:hypothetical protein
MPTPHSDHGYLKPDPGCGPWQEVRITADLSSEACGRYLDSVMAPEEELTQMSDTAVRAPWHGCQDDTCLLARVQCAEIGNACMHVGREGVGTSSGRLEGCDCGWLDEGRSCGRLAVVLSCSAILWRMGGIAGNDQLPRLSGGARAHSRHHAQPISVCALVCSGWGGQRGMQSGAAQRTT